MAYNRQLSSDDESVLMSCSICPFVGRYPGEIRYCSDHLFRCNVYCTETETPLEETKKRGRSVSVRDEQAPRFPVGVKPGWY